MKKILNGKMYNTETAELCGSYSNNKSYSDFGYIHECLYRKKNGKFFLHCEGGAMTIYAEHYGNASSYGQRITPLTESEARDWA